MDVRGITGMVHNLHQECTTIEFILHSEMRRLCLPSSAHTVRTPSLEHVDTVTTLNLFVHQVGIASLNARFTFTIFTLAPEDPRSDEVLEVRGSHLTAVFMLFETRIGENSTPVLVRIAYEPLTSPSKTHVTVAEKETGTVLVDTWFDKTSLDEDGFSVGGVNLKARVASPFALVASNADWKYTIMPGTMVLSARMALTARASMWRWLP